MIRGKFYRLKFAKVSRAVLAKQQSPLVMHDSQTNAVQPAPAAYKGVRRVAHGMKESHRSPLPAKCFNPDLVSVSREQARYGSIFPFNPRIREPEDIRIGIIEDASAAPVSNRALNSTLRLPCVNRTGTSIPQVYLVAELSVELERDQSIHPPVNGFSSSEETKIMKGEQSPPALASS